MTDEDLDVTPEIVRIRLICYDCASVLHDFNHTAPRGSDFGECHVCGVKKKIYPIKVFGIKLK